MWSFEMLNLCLEKNYNFINKEHHILHFDFYWRDGNQFCKICIPSKQLGQLTYYHDKLTLTILQDINCRSLFKIYIFT
jgi:hypothetical protein